LKFEVIDNCPVPAGLASAIHEIKRRTGATLNSCDRSADAEPFLKRCKPAKMSQRELYEGFRLGRPGFNPANPPGQSTHERRNDGVAYPGPAKLPLAYWCVGMDWENADGVIEAAAALGFTATRTYPLSAREQHHLNFRKEPKVRLLKPLRLGSKGYRVARMTQRLATVLDAEGKPYLPRGQGVFDAVVEGALRRFQADWGQQVDGVYGQQSSRQLGVAFRAAKEQRKPKPAVGAVKAPNPVKPEPVKPKPRPKPVPKKSAAKKPTALSKEGAAFIARFEGFRGQLYNDAAGHATIGYGHLVHHGPIDGSEPAEFRKGISQERALELLQADAAKAAAEIVRSVKAPLEQHQFDALVSFAFNVGNGAFRESTLLRLLNEGHYDAVEAQLARWNKAGGKTLQGLVNRRAAEAKLFNRGQA
jgi:GH24 family phage-related lysozyme (muramidase)